MSDGKDFAEFGVEFAQDNGADYAEARLIDGQRTFLFLRNGMLISGTQQPWLGIGFRVLKNGGLAFVSIDELSKNTVKNAINHGIKMARGSNPREKINLGEPVSNEAKWAVATEQRLVDVDTDTMLELLQEMDTKAEDHGINTRANIFEAQSYEKYLVTSEGTRIESESSMLKFYGILTAKGLLDSEQRWVDLTRSTGWEGTKTWIDQYDDECARLAKVAAQADNTMTGKVDFVVGHEVVGIICHENCGHPSEGDRIMGREGAQEGERRHNRRIARS